MKRLPLLSGVLLWAALASAEEPTAFDLRWKLQSSGVWPPAVSGDFVVVKTDDTLAAYSARSGRLIWTKQLSNLRLGEGTMAASVELLYVLSNGGLHMLELSSGKLVGQRALRDATGVIYRGGSLYVASAAGLQRLDARAGKLLQQAPGFHGELRAADGDYVTIYRSNVQKPGDRKASPKRLTVVNLGTGKQAFEFKLLRDGWHRIARMDRGRIVFIDYTVRQADGRNSRKLYYTEADYTRGKQLRDIDLSGKYTSAAADVFWITVGPSGRVFLANHGKGAELAAVFAIDPETGKTSWTRSGEFAGMGLLLHEGRLWTGLASPSAGAQVVAYSPETGDVLSRLPLEAGGTGTPVVAGSSLLLRTRSSIYCLAPRAGAALGLLGTAGQKTSWRLFRDRVAGYLIQIPDTWSFNRVGMRKLGGLRFVIPFVRTEASGSQTTVATVHILTWEAAGRDAAGLWKSILAQRSRSSPRVKIDRLERIVAQGPGGPPALLGIYNFRSAAGEPVQMRSLCLVSHNVAFELRGWVAPFAPSGVWQEVEGIFHSFQPKAPGTF